MAKMKPSTLDLGCVAPGSVLAADARDAKGTVLLARGAAVTAAQLQALRQRGIEHLTVLADVRVDVADSTTPATQFEARLDHLFRHASDNPAARELKQRILDFRRGQS
jgi:hypothetical protein